MAITKEHPACVKETSPAIYTTNQDNQDQQHSIPWMQGLNQSYLSGKILLYKALS